MNKYLPLVGCLLAVACGGSAYEGVYEEVWPTGEAIDAPEFAGFSSDQEKAAYCDGMGYGSNVCNPDYVEEKANWTTAQYYGFGDDNRPCYSPNGVASACKVPKFKQFKITFDTSQCLNNSVPLIQANQIVNDLTSAMLSLNVIGGGVTVSTTTGSQPVAVTCGSLPNGDLGKGGLSGISEIMIGNLPVAPNGKDETSGRQISGGGIIFNIQGIWDRYQHCLQETGKSDTSAQLRGFNFATGKHETLHTMGFLHFTTGIMREAFPCSEVLSGSQGTAGPSTQMVAALQHYVGGTTGPTILNDGLTNPQ